MVMKAIIIFCFILPAFVSLGQDIPADIRQLIASSKKDTALVNRLNEEKLNPLIYNNPEQAVALAKYVDSLAKQLKYRKGEARALDLMGDALLRVYNYPRSFEVQIQSIKINEEIDDKGAVAGCMISLSQLFAEQGDLLSQIAYLKQADSIARLAQDTLRISTVLQNLGNYYISQRKYDSALTLLQEAYAMVLKARLAQLAWVASSLSALHRDMKNYDLSLSYGKMAEASALIEKNNFVLANVYGNRMLYYHDMGQKDSAMFYANKGFALAEASNIPGSLYYFAYSLEELLRETDEKKANYYHKIGDSVYFNKVATDKNRMLASMLENEKYRQAKLLAQQLEAKKERKTSLQLTIIFITLIIIFVVFMLLSHSTIANQKLIRFLGILVLLVFFEFINLVLHPYLGEWTHHSPALMLLIMVGIAALLIPLHHKLEHWITHKLVEKNNRIRLAAAKKTIAQLEKEQTNT